MSSFAHSTKNTKRVFNQLAGVSSTFSRIGIGVRDADHELEVAGVVHISAEQSTAPGTPVAADGGVVYVKNDGDLYYLSQDVSEVSLTSSAGGGDANEFSFKTITFAGTASAEADVVADADADTLTLVAGDGVTITTTADQITFVATDTWRTVTAGGNTLTTSETLTLENGTGITIAELDGTVTITAGVRIAIADTLSSGRYDD
jgi:hypothetical protein